LGALQHGKEGPAHTATIVSCPDFVDFVDFDFINRIVGVSPYHPQARIGLAMHSNL